MSPPRSQSGDEKSADEAPSSNRALAEAAVDPREANGVGKFDNNGEPILGPDLKMDQWSNADSNPGTGLINLKKGSAQNQASEYKRGDKAVSPPHPRPTARKQNNRQNKANAAIAKSLEDHKAQSIGKTIARRDELDDLNQELHEIKINKIKMKLQTDREAIEVKTKTLDIANAVLENNDIGKIPVVADWDKARQRIRVICQLEAFGPDLDRKLKNSVKSFIAWDNLTIDPDHADKLLMMIAEEKTRVINRQGFLYQIDHLVKMFYHYQLPHVTLKWLNETSWFNYLAFFWVYYVILIATLILTCSYNMAKNFYDNVLNSLRNMRSSVKECIIDPLCSIFVFHFFFHYTQILLRVFNHPKRFILGFKTKVVSTRFPDLEDFCCRATKIEDVAPDRPLLRFDWTKHQCNSRSIKVGFTFAEDLVWRARGCIHDEVVATCKRALLPLESDPATRLATWSRATDWLNKNSPSVQAAPATEEDVDYMLRGKSANYKNQFKQAWLFSSNIPSNMGFVFVKLDEINTGKAVLKRKPRIVVSSTTDFLSLHSPDYYVYSKLNMKRRRKGRYLMTPGMSYVEIGRVVSQWEINGFSVYMSDVTSCDGSKSLECQVFRHQEYKKNFTRETAEHLIQAHHRQFKTKRGLTYNADYIQSSGMATTTYDNTEDVLKVTCSGLEEALNQERISTYFEVGVAGDDGITAVERPLSCYEHYKLEQFTLSAGLKISYELTDYDNLEYCSCIFWDVGEQRIMGYKIGRILAKTFFCKDDTIKDPLVVQRYMKGIALGFVHFRFLPGIDIIYEQFSVCPCDAIMPARKYDYQGFFGDEEIPIDQSSVDAHFERRYGFPAEDLREELRELDLTCVGMSYRSLLVDIMLKVDGVGGDFERNSAFHYY